ncbi:MAG: hypothetical protein ACUVXG_07930 [Anaerolineae bacterium]
MGFWEKLSRLFSGRGAVSPILWVYVRCDVCGEVIATRINLFNDLSATYEGGDRAYYLRKEVIGSRRGCYRPVEIELSFDSNRRVTSREARGGTFATQEDYLAQGSQEEV